MDEAGSGAPKGPSKFEAIEHKSHSLPGEILGYLGKNKKWWLLPIIAMLVIVGALLLLSSTAAAPFIYTLF